MEPVRIGVLGAARIVPMALLRPSREVAAVQVVAVAARDAGRAGAFAARHHIPRVHAGYQALLDDPEVEAVYNPLPNSLHAEWTLRALAAGKHVLCEKPLCANADEAAEVAAAASRAGRVVMEAFHYRYHPLAERMRALVQGGTLGAVRHIEARLCIPILPFGKDIRLRYDLAGGATMDAGCYAVHLVRTLAGAEPEVVAARARLASPRIDRWMQADLRFPDGATGRVTCSFLSWRVVSLAARAVGERGTMDVFNFVMPQLYHHIRLRTDEGRRTERVQRRPSSYACQLVAFAAAVREGRPVLTPPGDAVANMRVIDAMYEKSGLGRRGLPVA